MFSRLFRFNVQSNLSRTVKRATPVTVDTLERRTMFAVTPEPGSTLATAFNVGDLNGQLTLNDTVGNADSADAYRFTMPRDGTFFGRLRVDANAADISLVAQKFDGNGHETDPVLITQTASRVGTDDGFTTGDLPGQFLKAGTYFLFVLSRGAPSPYLVRMTADYAGESLAKARNIGSATDATFQDFVGQDPSPSLNDPIDLYKFKMDAFGQLTTTMSLDSTDFTTFKAHVSVIRDVNGNGAIDAGDIVTQSGPATTATLTKSLAAGTYFVEVASDLNFSNYHLHLNADYADPEADRVRAMGSLDSVKSFNDFIEQGADSFDDYSFSVSQNRPLFAAASETGGSLFLVLFKDTNNNGIADSSERVTSSGDFQLFGVHDHRYSGPLHPAGGGVRGRGNVHALRRGPPRRRRKHAEGREESWHSQWADPRGRLHQRRRSGRLLQVHRIRRRVRSARRSLRTLAATRTLR